MNDYPMWWSQTITVYNKYEDSQTQVIRWYRTVLDNCFWQNHFQRLKMGDMEVETDNVICRIPENESFREKYLWVKIPNDLMSNYFTLAQGDIIVKGNVDDEINEYQSGTRSSDLIQKYKDLGCMVVDKVNNNTGIGLGLPHYHVEGV